VLRTQICLTEEERRALDAVDAVYGSERSTEHDLAAMRRGSGSWRDRGEDGAAWVERLRSGRRLDRHR
jgi:hypothetical protein